MKEPNLDKPIGIFDSGVGGLTVVKALREIVPHETLCYFGDTARVPYGTKSAETIQRYSLEITRFLKSHDVKMIVVACNTVSSVSLPPIREQFEGPVIGVVEPGVRAAIQTTRSGRIGIIGTKSTIHSGAYQNHLLERKASLHVVAQACPLFVPLVEEGLEDDPITEGIVRRYLYPMMEEALDTVILGCTHYPLIAHVIQKVLGENVKLVSSADEAAKEVKETLAAAHQLSCRRRVKDLFYASDDIAGFQRLYERIFGNREATFIEAASDFFGIVQELHRFKSRLYVDPSSWFEPLP